MNGERIIGKDFNGRRIELKVGEEIQIELEGHGGTGYWWYFDQLDNSLLELISEDRKETDREKKHIAGGPVNAVWRLRARSPGSTVIKMDYYRVWEGKDKAKNHFVISVQISP